MSEWKPIQQDFEQKRKDLADADLMAQKYRAQLARLDEEERNALRATGSLKQAQVKEKFAAQRQTLASDMAGHANTQKELQQQYRQLAETHLFTLDPQEKVALLDDAYPILLFPLRLETRFKSQGNLHELWLRVYPDDCNIRSKEDLLSESEVATAKAFWIEMWKAGQIEKEEKGAWKSLVSSHGVGRAAWIMEHYKPGNAKPLKPDANHKTLVVISSLALSDAEHEAARLYWATVWLAKGNPTLAEAAYSTLKDAVGDAQATQIIEKYVPENLSDELPATLTADKILLEKLDLVPFDEYTATQTSWNKAPEAVALPDRFVAVAYTGSTKKTFLFERPVNGPLHVGPDPSLPKDRQIQKDANKDLVINDELKWMVDFDAAIAAGMGTKITLTNQEAVSGFSKLVVLGVRLSSNAQNGKDLLETLLSDHFYSKTGFEFLPQGTPTNNTEDSPAGYSWAEDSDESYERIVKQTDTLVISDDPFEKTDGQKLAESLGISTGILKNVAHATRKDQAESHAMNQALFPATLGYFLEEMMDPLFNDRDLEATKSFFTHFVSGRGPLPAIRIGKQPYGILPVTAYSRLQFARTPGGATMNNPKSPFLPRLQQLLQEMDSTWDSLIPSLPYVGKSGDAHQILLDVVGLHANSVEFHQRYLQSFGMAHNTAALFSEIINLLILRLKTQAVLNKFDINSTEVPLPILKKYFLNEPNLLSGPLVDDVPESETAVVRDYTPDGKNYLQWLAESGAETIRTQNFGGNAAPRALLYLLLRHSLMLAQSQSATGLMLAHNLVQSKRVFFDPDFMHIAEQDAEKSKFDHLYSAQPAITGNPTRNLAEHIYRPEIMQITEATPLRETVNALKKLQEIPTARLERLLVEHLDCCNYRIDAWKTGLVQYKLTEQRHQEPQSNTPSEGLYLGAYGWLLEVKPENKQLTNANLSGPLAAIFDTDPKAPVQIDTKNLGYIHAPSLNQAATAAILRNTYDSHKDVGTENPFAINLSSDRVRTAQLFLEGMRNDQSLSSLLGYQFERGLHDGYSLGLGEVDQFIYPLRKAFPLVADNLVDTRSEPTDAAETIQANHVVDGLKLVNHVQKSAVKTYPFGLPASLALPAANTLQADAINKEVKRIMDIHDAIADLVTAEQVYQVVQGNVERAAGQAEAFAKGSYPPDMEVVDTPRSGVTLTHRVAIHFNAQVTAATTPRAIAEPAINEWLAGIFPPATHVQCRVEYTVPGAAPVFDTVSQAQLGLAPIDLLYVLNSDAEQAMSELDDRISAYVRYTMAQHPHVQTTIHYTQAANAADKTVVSFFELTALVKSLRKLLMAAKPLGAAEMTVPTGSAPKAAVVDDTDLKDRAIVLKDGLDAVKLLLDPLLLNNKSLAGLAQHLITELTPYVSDGTLRDSLARQLQTDLKEYVSEPTVTVKNTLLAAFETALPPTVNPADVANLKITYGALLEEYSNDFSAFDDLAKKATEVFGFMALRDNAQMGTGFIQQGVASLYDRVFARLDKIIARWNQKHTDYTALLATYDPAGDNDIQLKLLQKMELLVAAKLRFPIPATHATYKPLLDTWKADFDTVLTGLKALKTTSKQQVTAFVADVETALADVAKYDVVAYDTDNDRNDLKPERKALAGLKEDISTALTNLDALLALKKATCEAKLALATTAAPAEKTALLQQAAQAILGEEALLLPRFTLEATQAAEVQNAFEGSPDLLTYAQTNHIFPVEDWLAGAARVREKMREWENTTFLGDAFVPGKNLDLRPMQFPYLADDRWLALAFTDGSEAENKYAPNSDKLLYTPHFAQPFDGTKPQCGIVLDEWTEVIPAREETTGLAFHYDQPNSEPPQTMLLVTPPALTGNWHWDDLLNALEETLETAKKRAVEPALIEETGYAQFLPTTMMAVTQHLILMATNLAVNNVSQETQTPG